MKSEFLKPKLVGERFEDHSIPVEVLKDWAAFEGLIVETAKWLYLQENSSRQRVPRGFSKDFSLHLSGVERGSAVPVLERIHPVGSLLPDQYAEWFDKARERVLLVIKTAASKESIDGLLPKHLLTFFDSFGRSLRDSEKVEFLVGQDSKPVIYDNKTRKSLVLSTASEYRAEELLRGSISELDAEKETLTFKLINGRKISACPFEKATKQQAHDALAAYGEALVLAECVILRDQSDTVKSIELISRIEPLDALDVPARLEALSLLRDGWLDGAGIAPSKEGLAWLEHEWAAHWPEDVSLPYIYPVPSGGVQAEWNSKTQSTSLEIDIVKRYGELVVANASNGILIEELQVNLQDPAGWSSLIETTRKYHALANNT